MAATSDALTLTAGKIAVELVPAIGGSIASFRLDGIDVMRPLSAADRAAGNVLGVASFPMVPFANRIGNNAFTFEGRTYRFETNNPPEIWHVHGTGWHRAWTVAAAGDRSATLTLEVVEPQAFSYRAEQRFVLDEAGLSLSTSVTNIAPQRMPFGFGHHPWFERDDAVTVEFAARTVHMNEPEMMIGERVTLPPELAFEPARPLPAYWRCTDYGGWSGVATVRQPARGVGLTMRGDPAYGHVMFYADPARPVFCVEPQTNASGAFNRPHGFGDPEDGVIVLANGESASAALRFEPFRL